MQSWSRRAFLMGSLGCLLAACSTNLVGSQTGNVPYSVGVRGEGNLVTIAQDAQEAHAHEDMYVVTVQSASGLGQASFAWWSSTRPHSLWFRLQLRGLEQFTLGWAERIVRVSVNSMDQQVIQSVQLHGGEETEIGPDSPYWMDVTMPVQEGDGYLVRSPAAFVADAPGLWGVSWVDFYR